MKHGVRGESREPGAPCGKREGRGRQLAPLCVSQDANAACMNKVELQAKVDSLTDDIKSFKCLYEGVRTPLTSLVWSAPLTSGSGPWPGWFHGPKVGRKAFGLSAADIC